ncbi:hypothetical protein BAMBUS_03500 [Brevundimonas phage vB_BpoS-Bambus]|nr:hypothetical protein BAMBUS_03500 [Brevundimonas phage vB_BpoS-Bambus]
MADLERYFKAGAYVLMLGVLAAYGLWIAWLVFDITRTRRWRRIARAAHEWVSPSYPLLGALAAIAFFAVLSVAIGWTLELVNLWPFWLAPVTS